MIFSIIGLMGFITVFCFHLFYFIYMVVFKYGLFEYSRFEQ